MRIQEIITPEYAHEISNTKVIGIDIGSRSAKGVLVADGHIYTALTATGLYMQETAEKIFTNLLKQAGLKRTDIQYIVGTGYGRIALEFEEIPNQIVTEISCHGMGAHFLNAEVRTVIDIGGQDSKAIKIDPTSGRVAEFVMNDKCAAGTGRFLEKIANLLDLEVTEIGDEALKAKKPSLISSQCVVFAESEVISMRAKGEGRADIAAGIHLSVARRVRNLLNRIGIEPGILFSGGVSNNIGMRLAMEELLEAKLVSVKLDTVFAGALGAAVYAQRYAHAGVGKNVREIGEFKLDLTDFHNRIAKQQESIIQGVNPNKKVGYLCAYTPPELFNAAGVDHFRLYKAGNTNEVASGELITQSVFCDFTKGCLGAFQEGNPLVSALDKVYTFYTCDSMKKVAEAINEYFVPTGIFSLPRVRDREASRDYFRSEIINLKKDLEKLTGQVIPEEKVREQIVLYNKIRELIRNISALRKRPNPPLTGQDFLELVKGFYYLPPEEQLSVFQGIYDTLSAVPQAPGKTLRLMMAGGIV
ncbi:MAG TPA: acyl-CoA dehydratase activase, partial [Negativicutes bacterium]|nr:acyl-CoA dehydratase activase [Negativicutes bacterium]